MSRTALPARPPTLLPHPGPARAPASFDLDPTCPAAPVLRVRGRLDRAAAPAARTAMCAALAGVPEFVLLDLAGVGAVDGPGAVLLVAMARHARRLGSNLRIVGARPAVRGVLRERGVEGLLDLHA